MRRRRREGECGSEEGEKRSRVEKVEEEEETGSRARSLALSLSLERKKERKKASDKRSKSKPQTLFLSFCAQRLRMPRRARRRAKAFHDEAATLEERMKETIGFRRSIDEVMMTRRRRRRRRRDFLPLPPLTAILSLARSTERRGALLTFLGRREVLAVRHGGEKERKSGRRKNRRWGRKQGDSLLSQLPWARLLLLPFTRDTTLPETSRLEGEDEESQRRGRKERGK